MAEGTLKIGDTAPDFAAPTDTGDIVRLSDDHGGPGHARSNVAPSPTHAEEQRAVPNQFWRAYGR